jgi:two-component system, chemotaxis family, protein-glutamate methylesterase/glutaminase
MKSNPSTIIVVGTSAGGMDALSRLVPQLPADFPAAILIVQHMAADATGDMLVKTLAEKGKLPCKHPQDGDKIAPGHIYIAPSDHHMLVEKGVILVTKGARENRSRPSIDPLFRSAAVAYGSGTIGVLLTGYLDDGTSGMMAIKRCGGICIVQDPLDAAFPDMPQSALNNLKVDHRVPLAQMGALLVDLVRRPRKGAHGSRGSRGSKQHGIPEDIVIEAKIAKRVLSDLSAVEALGDQVPFNCPECGGVLWQIAKGNLIRYRCHTGHAFTSAVLLAEQTEKIEETLWVALRMFEERRNLLQTMAVSKRGAPGAGEKSASDRAKDSEVHIARIRAMLLSSDKATNDGAGKD